MIQELMLLDMNLKCNYYVQNNNDQNKDFLLRTKIYKNKNRMKVDSRTNKTTIT